MARDRRLIREGNKLLVVPEHVTTIHGDDYWTKAKYLTRHPEYKFNGSEEIAYSLVTGKTMGVGYEVPETTTKTDTRFRQYSDPRFPYITGTESAEQTTTVSYKVIGQGMWYDLYEDGKPPPTEFPKNVVAGRNLNRYKTEPWDSPVFRSMSALVAVEETTEWSEIWWPSGVYTPSEQRKNVSFIQVIASVRMTYPPDDGPPSLKITITPDRGICNPPVSIESSDPFQTGEWEELDDEDFPKGVDWKDPTTEG